MRVLIAFILIFLTLALSAQEAGINLYSKPDKDQDSIYLRSYGNFFVPAVYTIRHFSSFYTKDNISKKQINYEPNIALGVGICASYKWLGIAGSSAFGFLNRDDQIYGKTKKMDFYTNLYSKRFLYDINFQYYNGYHISNPRVVDSTWKPGMSYPYRPDISTVTVGVAVYYIMNYKHFSLRAPYNYCDEQLHSSGSWILGGFTSLYSMAAQDSNIVPRNVPFQDTARMRALYSIDFGFSGGYAYTWVIKKHWFISGMILPGLSIQNFAGYNDITGAKSVSSLALKSQTRFAIGYSRMRFYIGWVLVFDAFNINTSKASTFQYKSGYTCLTVGTRILPQKHRRKTIVN
jgi:hypothetical protein